MRIPIGIWSQRPSGRASETRHRAARWRCGIKFFIDPAWSPEQALAVVELLDDLRERIWAHYAIALSEKYRNQFAPLSDDKSMISPDPDDPPF